MQETNNVDECAHHAMMMMVMSTSTSPPLSPIAAATIDGSFSQQQFTQDHTEDHVEQDDASEKGSIDNASLQQQEQELNNNNNDKKKKKKRKNSAHRSPLPVMFQTTPGKLHRHSVHRVVELNLVRLRITNEALFRDRSAALLLGKTGVGRNSAAGHFHKCITLRLYAYFKRHQKRVLKTNNLIVQYNRDNVNQGGVVATVDIDIRMYFQYIHFVKKRVDFLQLVLKKKKRNGWTTVGTVAVNMAHVLQFPFDDVLEFKNRSSSAAKRRKYGQTRGKTITSSSPGRLDESFDEDPDESQQQQQHHQQQQLQSVAKLHCTIETKPLTTEQLQQFRKAKRAQDKSIKLSKGRQKLSSPQGELLDPSTIFGRDPPMNDDTHDHAGYRRSVTNLILYQDEEEEEEEDDDDDDSDDSGSDSDSSDDDIEDDDMLFPLNDIHQPQAAPVNSLDLSQQIPSPSTAVAQQHQAMKSLSASPQAQLHAVGHHKNDPSKKLLQKALKDIVKGFKGLKTPKGSTSANSHTNSDDDLGLNSRGTSPPKSRSSSITPTTDEIDEHMSSARKRARERTRRHWSLDKDAPAFKSLSTFPDIERQLEALTSREGNGVLPELYLVDTSTINGQRIGGYLRGSNAAFAKYTICTLSQEDVHSAVVRFISINKSCLAADGEDGEYIRITLVGADSYINCVLQQCMEATAESQKLWRLIRFFIVPSSSDPSTHGISRYIGSVDQQYADMFWGRDWKQIFTHATGSLLSELTREHGAVVEKYILQYTREATNSFDLPIAQALVVHASSDSDAELQRMIPFVRSVQIFGSGITYKHVQQYIATLGADGTSDDADEDHEHESQSKKMEPIDLKMDFWQLPSTKQMTTKHSFQYVAVYRMEDEFLDKSSNLLLEKQQQIENTNGFTLCTLRTKKSDFKKLKKAQKALKAELVSKVICAFEKRRGGTIFIDGTEFSDVKFVSITAQNTVMAVSRFAQNQDSCERDANVFSETPL